MRDIIVARYPSGALELFTRERDAWRFKRLYPSVRLYRYAYIGEAAKRQHESAQAKNTEER